VVDDLTKNPGICKTFEEVFPQIETIAQLRTEQTRTTASMTCGKS
jgi:hypothetical protein